MPDVALMRNSFTASYSRAHDEIVDLGNTLHGQLVGAALEVLLIDAGYQLIPTGIERSLRELRPVGVERYLELAPRRLRTIPDLFVLDLDADASWLVEVKFRRYLHPRLIHDLEALLETWSPVVLVLVLAEPPDEWSGEVRHIRAFDIDEQTDLTVEFLRDQGTRLQDVFLRLKQRWAEGTIVRVQEAILRLIGPVEE